MNKLILLDIFSYSCMNCLRSLEFIKKIDNKYKKYGLDTILIHTPEWKFEKNIDNIILAIKNNNIKIPIIIDKNKRLIKKLKINFWPAQILIKANKILYKNIGEGNYSELESKIIQALKIKTKKIFKKEPKYTKYLTLYCGKKKKGKIIKSLYKLKFGRIHTDKNWVQKHEYIKSSKKSSLTILTKGKIINFVAESLSKKNIRIDVKLNNKKIKYLTINKPRLYKIAILNNHKQRRLTINTKLNLAIYSFSFQ